MAFWEGCLLSFKSVCFFFAKEKKTHLRSFFDSSRKKLTKTSLSQQNDREDIWVFPKIVVPQNGWFIRETLLEWMIWGYPYFWKHPFGF